MEFDDHGHGGEVGNEARRRCPDTPQGAPQWRALPPGLQLRPPIPCPLHPNYRVGRNKLALACAGFRTSQGHPPNASLLVVLLAAQALSCPWRT